MESLSTPPMDVDDEYLMVLICRNGESELVDARIVAINDEEVLVDIDEKFEAHIPLSDWDGSESLPKIGDTVVVMVEQGVVDDRPKQVVRVSRRVTPQLIDWRKIVDNVKCGQACAGRIVRKIDQGFLVDIGVNVFLPDQAATDEMRARPEEHKGQQINCVITKIEYDMNRIEVALE